MTEQTIKQCKSILKKNHLHPIRKIGKGAFAMVFLVQRIQLTQNQNEFLSVKCINKKQIIKRPSLNKYIKQQIEIFRNMQHDNIVRLQRTFEDQGWIFMVMQYCNKGNLSSKVSQNNQNLLSIEETFYISWDIIKGLDYIHKKNLIHRDIKAENILLIGKNNKNNISNNNINNGSIFTNTSSSNGLKPAKISIKTQQSQNINFINKSIQEYDYMTKICDFGFAREQDQSVNTFCGTTCYMAPQIFNKLNYDNKVDIWSLGVLMFYMLFGEFPFKGMNIQYEIQKKCNHFSISKIKQIKHNESISNKDYQLLDQMFRNIFVINPLDRIGLEQLKQYKWFWKYQNINNINNINNNINLNPNTNNNNHINNNNINNINNNNNNIYTNTNNNIRINIIETNKVNNIHNNYTHTKITTNNNNINNNTNNINNNNHPNTNNLSPNNIGQRSKTSNKLLLEKQKIQKINYKNNNNNNTNNNNINNTNNQNNFNGFNNHKNINTISARNIINTKSSKSPINKQKSQKTTIQSDSSQDIIINQVQKQRKLLHLNANNINKLPYSSNQAHQLNQQIISPQNNQFIRSFQLQKYYFIKQIIDSICEHNLLKELEQLAFKYYMYKMLYCEFEKVLKTQNKQLQFLMKSLQKYTKLMEINIKKIQIFQTVLFKPKAKQFTQIKEPYRLVIGHVFSKTHKHVQVSVETRSQLKLKLFICHVINRVFNPQTNQGVFVHFQNYINKNKLSKNSKLSKNEIDFRLFKKWIQTQSADRLVDTVQIMNARFYKGK